MDGDLVTGFKPTPGLVRLLFGTNQEILGQKYDINDLATYQSILRYVYGDSVDPSDKDLDGRLKVFAKRTVVESSAEAKGKKQSQEEIKQQLSESITKQEGARKRGKADQGINANIADLAKKLSESGKEKASTRAKPKRATEHDGEHEIGDAPLREPTASSSKNQGGIHVVRGLGVTGRGSQVIPFGNNKFEHLSDEEAIMLNKLFTSAGVTPSPSQAKELARTNGGRVFVESIKDLRAKLSVLLGEVQAGNTSVEVKNDIANIANFLNSRKVLAKKKLAEILEFIHNAVIPYSWTNISAELGNNTYQYNNGSTLRTVTMPDGMYSYEAMDQYLRATMDSNSDYDTDVNGFRVYHIRFYTNTVLNKLSVVIDGGYSLIIPNTPFKVTTGLTPGTYTTSVSSQTLPVINTANQVSLRCSLVSNPYANPDELFRFSPDVPPTDIIHLEPVNLQWTPCSNGGFREISISVHDENGNPITLVDKKISYTLKFRVPIIPEKP
ncbi:hypothetical protein CAOG_03960 [Capsaspora owczarzaki ATCC 30864]|nr:hypothetical protein CAOG_03960 [Capsaspora owczarzaki ATCC 30864]|eukprot:XP_004363688.1 hypothetical protein CAOG_03960 [Capsaspora owczarzaki ATCC 30864]